MGIDELDFDGVCDDVARGAARAQRKALRTRLEGTVSPAADELRRALAKAKQRVS